MVISMKYKRPNPNHNCNNRTNSDQNQETLQFFSLFEFDFSSHNSQRSLHILVPGASLSQIHPLLKAIHQDFMQFKSIIMLMEIGN